MELSNHLKALTKTFFSGAKVMWAQEKRAQSKNPRVILSLGDVSRSTSPRRQTIDGVVVDSYPSQVMLQVDLYTNGYRVSETEWDNTAASDLTEFVNFINSPYVDDWCATYDIAITAMEPVRDLTKVLNDSSWDYRAMCEFTIGFTQVASGHTGIGYEHGNPLRGEKPFKQSASGGGSSELASLFTGYFTEVDLQYGHGTLSKHPAEED